MKLSPAGLRIVAISILPVICCGGIAFAGVSAPAIGAPALDPGAASSGIALMAVAGILLIERYRSP